MISMDLGKYLNPLVVVLFALPCMSTLPNARVQDCRQYPQECNAKQVLSDFISLYDLVSTDNVSHGYCEKFTRTSLSEDGTTAEYDVLYTHEGDPKPINDTCTFQAANNILMYMSCVDYSSYVYHFKMDYINGAHCYVGHSNFTAGSDTQYYYMLVNPHSDFNEYRPCFSKIMSYTGGNVKAMRDDQTCRNITPKP